MKAIFVELPSFARYRPDYLDDENWWYGRGQFWLFTLYGKDEMDDLSSKEKKALREMLKYELESRR